MFNIFIAIALTLVATTVDGQKTVYHMPTSKKVHDRTYVKYDYKPATYKVVKEDKPSPKPVSIVITKKDDDKDVKPSPKPASPKPAPKAASPKPTPEIAPQPTPKPSPNMVSPSVLSDEDIEFMAKPGDVLSDEDIQASPEQASPTEAAPTEPESTECTTVADAVVGTPELSTLLSALQAADLVDTFTDPELVATILAPTNEAFDVLITAFNATAEQVLSDPQLKNILQYHVIPDVAVLSTELQDGVEVPTLLGQDLTVSLSADEVTFEGDQTSAKVVTPDIEACKAVVHVIDTVLLPDFSALA